MHRARKAAVVSARLVSPVSMYPTVESEQTLTFCMRDMRGEQTHYVDSIWKAVL